MREYTLIVDLDNNKFGNYDELINSIRLHGGNTGYKLKFETNEKFLFQLKVAKDYNVLGIQYYKGTILTDVGFTKYQYGTIGGTNLESIFSAIKSIVSNPEVVKTSRYQIDILINLTSEAIRFRLIQNFFSNLQDEDSYDFDILKIIYQNWSDCLKANGKQVPQTVETREEHIKCLNSFDKNSSGGKAYGRALKDGLGLEIPSAWLEYIYVD